jgi:uncharacterized membrane protein
MKRAPMVTALVALLCLTACVSIVDDPGGHVTVQAQNEEIFEGDARTGNNHVKKALAAFMQLRSHGDSGRDALAVLLSHPRMDVR